jgi:hypothetical protein
MSQLRAVPLFTIVGLTSLKHEKRDNVMPFLATVTQSGRKRLWMDARITVFKGGHRQ